MKDMCVIGEEEVLVYRLNARMVLFDAWTRHESGSGGR